MTKQRAEYIQKYQDVVIQSCEGTGILPSVKMAQAIIESKDGKSDLAAKYNNHFGIKADKSWKGKKIKLSTKEVINGKWVTVTGEFRVYSDPVQSFLDHSSFLTQNSRYKKALAAKTPEEQCKELQAAGYATAPTYASALMVLIRGYNLKSLDEKKNERKTTWVWWALAIAIVLLILILLIRPTK